jgi:hypothetical protein
MPAYTGVFQERIPTNTDGIQLLLYLDDLEGSLFIICIHL